MEFTIFDLATLLEVRRKQDGIVPFWLNFFRRTVAFETKFIDFELVARRYRKLAPFVSPNVQGRVITTQGSEMLRFAPAYVKPKSVVDPQKVISRQIGETLYQPMSNAARRDAVIAEEIKEHRVRIENREEWLAANALIYGEVDISGEDYPTSHVDFRRDPRLTATLTGGARWDQTTAKPLDDIRNMRRQAKDISGLVIRRHIFGQKAWDAFSERMGFNDPKVGNLLDTTFRGSDTNISRLLDGFEGAEFVGNLVGINGQGLIECWVYSGTYEDDDGVEQDFLDPRDVVGIGPIDGVRCYGAIQDAKAGYRAMQVFMKNYVENDPSVEYILSQSAPLMVPAEPNASYRMRVVD